MNYNTRDDLLKVWPGLLCQHNIESHSWKGLRQICRNLGVFTRIYITNNRTDATQLCYDRGCHENSEKFVIFLGHGKRALHQL